MFFGKYRGSNGNMYCGHHIRLHSVTYIDMDLVDDTNVANDSNVATVDSGNVANVANVANVSNVANVANVANVGRREVGFMICNGITRMGQRCKNYGCRNVDGDSYCHHHCPLVCPDIDALVFDDPVRPIVRYGDVGVNVDEKCPICFLVLKSETIVKTNCGHVFHQSCIDKWLGAKQTCPLCRTVTHIRRGSIRRIEVIEYN